MIQPAHLQAPVAVHGQPMRRALTLFLALALLPLSVQAAEQIDAYVVRSVWLGNGLRIDRAVLVTTDGKITAVGSQDQTPIPKGAQVHQLDDQVIIPGLIAAGTQLADTARAGERSLSPEILAWDGFDFYQDHVRYLAAGVTTVELVPSQQRLMAGQSAIVKLSGQGPDQRTLERQAALQICLTRQALNPPTVFDPPVGAVSVERPLTPTRTQLASTLAGAVAGLRAVWQAGEQGPADVDNPLEKVLSGYRGQNPGRGNSKTVHLRAESPAEVQAALNLADQIRCTAILVDPSTAEPLIEEPNRWSPVVRGVIVNAGFTPGQINNPALPAPDELVPDEPWEIAGQLRDRGWPVAVRATNDGALEDLLFTLNLFTRRLPPEEALRLATEWPAVILGIDERVGTLEVGKDADFVILNDDPFAHRPVVQATYIDGNQVYDRQAHGRTKLLRGVSVVTAQGTLADQSIVVRNGTIRDIGTDVSAPLDADLSRFEGAVVVPGFIDMYTALGMGAPLSGNVPLQTKLGEQLFDDDPAVAYARQGGVTTVLLGSNANPTPVVAFKLGDRLRVLKDPVAIRFAMTGNLTAQTASLQNTLRQGKAYHDAWQKYDQEMVEYEKQLKEYEAAKARYDAAQRAKQNQQPAAGEEDKEAEPKPDSKEPPESGGNRPGNSRQETTERASGQEDQPEKKPAADDSPAESNQPAETTAAEKKADDSDAPKPPKAPEKPKTNEALEPYRELFTANIPALVEARKADEVRAAIKMFRDEFKLPTVLIGADDVVRDEQLLDGHDVTVAVGPDLFVQADAQPFNVPQILANQGIKFGFQSQATTGVRQLPMAVQYSVSKGLGSHDALHALSTHAAGMLSLDDRIGALEAGKDADLVVLSGPPFAGSTRVLAVMIDGEWVYQQTD